MMGGNLLNCSLESGDLYEIDAKVGKLHKLLSAATGSSLRACSKRIAQSGSSVSQPKCMSVSVTNF